MATPYPLPRSTRETGAQAFDGVSTVFGPFSFQIADIEDVEVWIRDDEDAAWSDATGVTVAKQTSDAFSYFTVTFDQVHTAPREFNVRGLRVHERSIALTKGVGLDTSALEAEHSKIGTVLQELRRDVEIPLSASAAAEEARQWAETASSITIPTGGVGTAKLAPKAVTSDKLEDDITIAGTLTLPVSEVGTVSLLLGSQPGGPTGIYIYQGHESYIGFMTQGNDSAHIQNGVVVARGFNSFGNITIVDDGHLKIDFSQEFVAGYQGDRAGVMIISGSGVNTGAMVQFRGGGTNGEVSIWCQNPAGNVEITAANDNGPTVTLYTDGKFTIVYDKVNDCMYFINRRGVSMVFTWTNFGSGSSMSTGPLFVAPTA